MKKAERVASLLGTLDVVESEYSPFYTGYFRCFNAGEYYEAHDVLEQLWLGSSDQHSAFYKGLIQVAGAFVHLRKQHERPWHAKDGRRMRPAVRLFHLGLANIVPYGPRHLRLDVASLHALCTSQIEIISQSDFQQNPWSPRDLPQLYLTS